jgi:hypothetical protein
VIVRLPGAAFADNSHAGAFVRELCARAAAAAAEQHGAGQAGQGQGLLVRKACFLSVCLCP